MSGGSTAAPGVPAVPPHDPTPTWPTWLLLGLLVLPFHPLWVDFEQVRRGLLLLLAGAALVLRPRLRAVRGERAALGFLGFLLLCGLVRAATDAWLRDAKTPASFQAADAGYRLAHWLALGVLLRFGAMQRTRASLPFAGVLLATSLFGLLQRLGLAEIAGYGVEREPVSTLGNLNVASEWTAVAAMVTAVLLPRCTSRTRMVAMTALALAAAYLVVDGSRSGLIALPIGLVLLAILRRREQPWPPLLLALLGGLVGVVLAAATAQPAPADAAAATAERQRSTSTLQVRLEIAKGTTRLFGESPIFGHGPGQFAIHYPRFRSQDEIELSSHGRAFATEVRTAHDDWLELLVDGGLPALVLFAAMLFALQRHQRDKANLLPLFVALLLMLVRSPLGNAPAMAAALWLVGEADGTARERPWTRPLSLLLGLAMLVLGVLPVAGNCAIAPYQRAAANDQPTPIAAAANAAWWMPFEPRWLTLLARAELSRDDLASARKHAAAAVALRPFDPQAYELLVEVLVRGKAFDAAAQLVRFGLQLDPVHPELRMWSSWLRMHKGDVDGAITAVVDKPHPRLREQLAAHFGALAGASQDAGERARYAAEHHFVAAVDGLGQKDDASLQATSEHVQQLVTAMRASKQRDVRPLLLGALSFLDRGQIQDAIDYGKAATKLPGLQPYQRALLGDQLQRLRNYEVWQPVLDAR
jgi:O-antigen ligase